MNSPIDRLNALRLKVRDGVVITKEEAREALELMREQRKGMTEAIVAKEKKGKAPNNLNDLFD